MACTAGASNARSGIAVGAGGVGGEGGSRERYATLLNTQAIGGSARGVAHVSHEEAIGLTRHGFVDKARKRQQATVTVGYNACRLVL